jgi:hypothetical protein
LDSPGSWYERQGGGGGERERERERESWRGERELKRSGRKEGQGGERKEE